MTSDSVAQDQIKAFVERINASPRMRAGSPADLAFMLNDRVARFEYVIPPLIPLLPRIVPNADRAFTAGGQLLGCDTQTTLHRVRAWKRRGGLEAVDADHMSWANVKLWTVAPLSTDLAGYVYCIAATDFPGIVKVGFSRDPEVRCQQLRRDHGISLELLTYVPGTMLDEHLLQVAVAEKSLANEWFDLTGNWSRDNPLAWAFTPKRMWNEMRGER